MTDLIFNVSDARIQLPLIVGTVNHGHKPVTITKFGKPYVRFVPHDDVDRSEISSDTVSGISIVELRQNFAKILDDAHYSGQPQLVNKNSKPVAWIVPEQQAASLDQYEGLLQRHNISGIQDLARILEEVGVKDPDEVVANGIEVIPGDTAEETATGGR